MSINKKILFLGDSLGLPRHDQTVIDTQTWGYLTQKKFKHSDIDFFYQFNGGASSKTLLSMRRGGYVGGYHPDIVILQVGIVDCASRVLGEKVVKFISSIPIVSTMIRRFINKYHKQLLTLRDKTYVTKKEFKKYLAAIKDEFGSAYFIVVPIAPPTKEYLKLMPRIERNVREYNEILQSIFSDSFLKNAYNDFSAEELMTSDHHHLSIKGHQVLSQAVIKKLDNFLKSQEQNKEP